VPLRLDRPRSAQHRAQSDTARSGPNGASVWTFRVVPHRAHTEAFTTSTRAGASSSAHGRQIQTSALSLM
jgi:hypothetical protein